MEVLEDAFLARFKKTKDVYSLLYGFFQIEKREDKGIQDFIDWFDQTLAKILNEASPIL